MTLILIGQYEEKYLDRLINQIEDEIIRSIDVKQIERFQEYNDKNKILVDYNEIPIDVLNGIYLGISSIQYRIVDNKVIININENQTYKNSNVKLVDICKFVNNGNLTIPSYPIFSKIFSNYQRMNRQGLI